MLPVAPLCDGAVHDLELTLDGDGGGGRVQLSVSYSPFTGAEPQIRQSYACWPILCFSGARFICLFSDLS